MIYKDVLSLVPDYWKPMKVDEKYRAVPLLDVYSYEYVDVSTRLTGSYYTHSAGMYRVQNPLMWAKFLHKKFDYQQRGPVEIKTLYHDTNAENIDSICQFNLDWKMGERFMFGPGVYFSISPDIAFKHSSKKNSRRAMFIFDVLVQNVQKGDEDIFLPDPGKDTVLAHADQTYVKYFDCEYYPRYFMSYKGVSLPSDSRDIYSFLN